MNLTQLALIGDLHLSERSPRHAHLVAVLDHVVDELVALQRADGGQVATAFLGDLVEGSPSPTEYRTLLQRIRRLAALGPVAVVLGNHEAPTAFCWLEDVLPGVTVAWDEVRLWQDRLPATVMLLPYPRLGRPPFDQLEDDGTLAGAQRAAAARIAQGIATARRLAADRPVLVLGHVTIEGLTTRDVEFERHRATEVLMPPAAFEGVALGAVGHIHRAQALAPHLLGVGSLIRQSFAEAEDPKSYTLVTLDAGRVTWVRRPVPARPLYEEAVTWPLTADDRARLAALIAVAPGAEVKLVVTCPEDQLRTWAPTPFAPLEAAAAWCRIERRVQPVPRPRAPGLAPTATLAEQLAQWATGSDAPLDGVRAARLTGKLARLEAV